MNDLAFVQPAEIPPRFKFLLYGTPGSWKSVTACSAPGPVLAINADRPHAFSKARAIHGEDKIREVKYEDGSTLDNVYRYLRDDEQGQEIKTLVVDPLGEIYQKLARESSASNTGAAHGHVHQDNWNEAIKKITGFLEAVSDLPINIVLVCHEQIDDKEEELVRRPMTGGTKMPEQIMGKMDVVAYLTVKDDDGVEKCIAQMIDGNGRRGKGGNTLGLGAWTENLNITNWVEGGDAALKTAPKLEAVA